ncbi:HPr kinase [Chloroherpeton thalassium ATCC 35110]|uniref:HPr kinase/phosphorylase n=1 Tax=Chloroherpeton thalassium (strain ATCC 35110 / GB-78) TaxID=517418 RepID=HPRK_CHLT3|nr:HPr(Ser) kinase/phosphatase [Chloroherpeton thalassium]B3QY08.1 RecName: Full=HPr kinase/phosphorylase; Short=HPrK/P; AltName: Full=HPr(Ser) kinase/phosphorylase [Chloroherpeton thalassium ATCC 35110]ACF13536.1 HPr kinase [Chloroherpeton thalassium ATCC 35110]
MDFKKKPIKKKSITVAYFYEHLSSRLSIKLKKLNQVDEEKRKIYERDIHRPGLALAGFTNLFTYRRVQVFGNTETWFLNHLGTEERKQAFSNITRYKVPCIIVTNNNKLDPELVEMATEAGIPLYRTSHTTTKFIYLITDFLDDQFCHYQHYHGSMVDVYGVGMFITGRSGIGKSEVALDLIERGHRLVADDLVVITRKGESVLMASGTELVRHFMEIRGLGIIDVEAMFGIRAIRHQKRVEIVVELLEFEPGKEFDRTGLENKSVDILGVEVPLVQLPIYPGKNITVIAEVVALNYLLKHYGYDAAEEFDRRIQQQIATRATVNNPAQRAVEYFEHDFE